MSSMIIGLMILWFPLNIFWRCSEIAHLSSKSKHRIIPSPFYWTPPRHRGFQMAIQGMFSVAKTRGMGCKRTMKRPWPFQGHQKKPRRSIHQEVMEQTSPSFGGRSLCFRFTQNVSIRQNWWMPPAVCWAIWTPIILRASMEGGGLPNSDSAFHGFTWTKSRYSSH